MGKACRTAALFVSSKVEKAQVNTILEKYYQVGLDFLVGWILYQMGRERPPISLDAGKQLILDLKNLNQSEAREYLVYFKQFYTAISGLGKLRENSKKIKDAANPLQEVLAILER